VLNVVDGCIPGDMATGSPAQIEEERRLLYVAMTRAKQHLHLLVPQRFYVAQQGRFGDQHMVASLTRFIPPSVALAFDRVAPTTCGAQAIVPEETLPALDLRERVRAMWG
jgi:DNA helicase-2/ATP-dependent DNA helicase PcrA